MYHESLGHKQNSFLTLTYRDPPPVSINKRHLQLFFKRLRKHISFRYFACGEYGEQTRRPHYHAILFGSDFLANSYKITDTLWGNKLIDDTWGHGFATIGSVTQQSCSYVAGYVNKKIGDPDTFNLMSRRPGIGATWVDEYHQDIKNNSSVIINGKQNGIPKRYLENNPETFAKLIQDRKDYYKKLTPEQRWTKSSNLRNLESQLKGMQSLKAQTI